MGTHRSETECRQHYCRVLNRQSKRGRWAPDEVELLIQAVNAKLGWIETARFVGTRDKDQCRTKWEQLVRKNSNQWEVGGESNV